MLLASYQHGINVQVARISNPYGPEQNIDGRQGFIAMVIGSALRGSPVILRNDGLPVRDFIYIDDLAEALMLCGLSEQSSSVVNIGSGNGYSLKNVLNLMEDLVGKKIPTIASDSRLSDIPYSVFNIEFAKKSLSFQPSINLRQGLLKVLKHHGFDVSHADS